MEKKSVGRIAVRNLISPALGAAAWLSAASNHQDYENCWTSWIQSESVICGDQSHWVYTNSLREKTTNIKYKIQNNMLCTLVSGLNTTVKDSFGEWFMSVYWPRTNNLVTAYDTHSVQITADKVRLSVRNKVRSADPWSASQKKYFRSAARSVWENNDQIWSVTRSLGWSEWGLLPWSFMWDTMQDQPCLFIQLTSSSDAERIFSTMNNI